jgi:hypothetical protein
MQPTRQQPPEHAQRMTLLNRNLNTAVNKQVIGGALKENLHPCFLDCSPPRRRHRRATRPSPICWRGQQPGLEKHAMRSPPYRPSLKFAVVTFPKALSSLSGRCNRKQWMAPLKEGGRRAVASGARQREQLFSGERGLRSGKSGLSSPATTSRRGRSSALMISAGWNGWRTSSPPVRALRNLRRGKRSAGRGSARTS